MECPHLALWTEYINYLKKADKTRNEIVSTALLFDLSRRYVYRGAAARRVAPVCRGAAVCRVAAICRVAAARRVAPLTVPPSHTLFTLTLA